MLILLNNNVNNFDHMTYKVFLVLQQVHLASCKWMSAISKTDRE